MSDFNNYHQLRGNDINNISYTFPKYLLKEFGNNKDVKILDIGCGNGSILYALKREGYSNLFGIDLDDDALEVARKNGILCENQDALFFFPKEKYDIVYMSHVLEHLPKEQVISFLSHINNNILTEEGKFIVRVPNAQSNTNCYWAYEDFTHNTLFTAGSLDYVLKAAGFKKIDFLDVNGMSDSTFIGKIIKTPLLMMYKFNQWFWNHVTGSAYHSASKVIYTWELKAVAYKHNND